MSTKPNLKLALVQCPIVGRAPRANLDFMAKTIGDYAQTADLIIFPETITTGFLPDAADYAEAWEQGVVYRELQALARQYQVAICCSYLVVADTHKANRLVLFEPDGTVQWQDKRHLFSLGGEPDMIVPANERKLLTYRGWRIMPTICYDLRFPVWCRNVDNEYDLLLCLANWPKPRREVWTTLLKARAMENIVYCVGVNRIGTDETGLIYTGDSAVIDPRGRAIASAGEGQSEVILAEIAYEPLADLRQKFPVWQDADSFTLNLDE